MHLLDLQTIHAVARRPVLQCGAEVFREGSTWVDEPVTAPMLAEIGGKHLARVPGLSAGFKAFAEQGAAGAWRGSHNEALRGNRVGRFSTHVRREESGPRVWPGR